MPFPDDHAENIALIGTKSARADVKQVMAIAASWNPTALRREQLNDPDSGPMMEEVESRWRQK
jgi:hypothetical protein